MLSAIIFLYEWLWYFCSPIGKDVHLIFISASTEIVRVDVTSGSSLGTISFMYLPSHFCSDKIFLLDRCMYLSRGDSCPVPIIIPLDLVLVRVSFSLYFSELGTGNGLFGACGGCRMYEYI